MLIKVKDKDRNEWKDLNLFRCGCGHPVEERNIRFKVARIATTHNFIGINDEIIVQGTICRFCPYCYTMHETPFQELHLNVDNLSDLATRMIIEKEKQQ